jgi:hypothetical protein
VSITHSERDIWSRTMFTSHHFQRHYQNCESESTPQSGTSHKTCLRVFGGNGSIAWTSAVSLVGRTSNAFKVTMKLQTFLFQMVVTSCNSVQYLWKYGFAKYSDNLYASCIFHGTGNSAQLCQNLRIFVGLTPSPFLCTPPVLGEFFPDVSEERSSVVVMAMRPKFSLDSFF